MNTAASANRTLLSNSAIAIAGTLASALASVAYVSLGARWLGPVEYGSVGATISLANVLFLALSPLDTGMTLRVAALTAQASAGQLRTFGVRLLRGISIVAAGLLGIWLASSALVVELVGQGTRQGVQWLGVFFCASLAACVPRAFLRGREMFIKFSANLVIESVLRFIVGLSLIAGIGGSEAMVAGYGLGMALALAHGVSQMFAGLPSQPTREPPFSWRDTLQPFRVVSLPLMGINLYTALVLNADVIAAKHFLSAQEAGMYAGSASLSRLVLMGAAPVLNVLLSRIAMLSAAGQDTKWVARRAAPLIAGVLVLSLLVPAIEGELLLRWVLGEAYVGAAQMLLYQWAAVSILTVQSFAAYFMLATGTVRGAWLFLLPCALLCLGLAHSHGSGIEIARVTVFVCAVPGSMTYIAVWYLQRHTRRD